MSHTTLAVLLTLVGHAAHARNGAPTHDALGMTWLTHLPSAPFAGSTWGDQVLVFVPHHFTPSAEVSFVVHFHGFATTPTGGVEAMRLRHQLTASGKNAVLISPQCPMRGPTAPSGKMAHRGGFRALLLDALGFLRDEGLVEADARLGPVLVTAHSGAFPLAVDAARFGDAPVAQVVLLDALYGRHADFVEWITDHPSARFVSLASNGSIPDRSKSQILGPLTARGVPALVEVAEGAASRRDLRESRIAFLASPWAHFACVYHRLVLRDILAASPLPVAVETGWALELDARPRRLERFTDVKRELLARGTPAKKSTVD